MSYIFLIHVPIYDRNGVDSRLKIKEKARTFHFTAIKMTRGWSLANQNSYNTIEDNLEWTYLVNSSVIQLYPIS